MLIEGVSGSPGSGKGKSTSLFSDSIKYAVPVAAGTERAVGVAAGDGVISFLMICVSRDFGNEESGGKTAILYTIVENCRRLGINSKEYLEDVLTRLPAMKASEAVTLTPANWLKARIGKAVRKVA
jgi:hypothetical protein